MGSGARSRNEAEQLLIRKAQEDEAFRKRLLADPKKIISEELGVSLSGVSVKVLEESPTQLYLVLPPSRHGELADGDLDAVAGGLAAEAAAQRGADAGKFSKGPGAAPLEDPLNKDKLGQGGLGSAGSM